MPSENENGAAKNLYSDMTPDFLINDMPANDAAIMQINDIFGVFPLGQPLRVQ